MNGAQRVAMAKCNLEAATGVMPQCAFLCAINNLKNALDWLGGGSWSAEYDLTRAINNTLAQAYFGFGESVKCENTADLIWENARYFDDKLEASFTLISSLSAQGKLEAVIELCVALLQGLGGKFPRKISKTQMSFEMMKTKRKLKGMGNSAIPLIPQMIDQKTIHTVRLMMEIEYHAFFLHQKEVWCMATLRALQLTLANGRAEKAPYIFASYGMLHAHLGNNKEAYRFGELAMKVTDITSEKSSMAQTTCKAALFCLHWERNLQELMEPLTRACHVGNACGDIEWAILNGATLISVSLACGWHLFEIEDEAHTMCQGVASYNGHENSLRICLPLWQCASNLSTRGNSALDLTGDAMNQEQLINICIKTRNHVALGTIWVTRLQLACYFQNWAVALEMIKKLDNAREFQAGGSFSSYFYKFFKSLTYIALDR
jgi:predicted ATPase